MTTCVYDYRRKVIAADRKNTDSAGAGWETRKIETLPNGWWFLGSGHCRSIALARAWAATLFDPDEEPDWEFILEDPDDRDMQCLVISPDGEIVYMINGELTPIRVYGDWFAIGSGAPYAIGALHADISAKDAVWIASEYDNNTGMGVDVIYLNDLIYRNDLNTNPSTP